MNHDDIVIGFYPVRRETAGYSEQNLLGHFNTSDLGKDQP